jgi:hypothetical protein
MLWNENKSKWKKEPGGSKLLGKTIKKVSKARNFEQWLVENKGKSFPRDGGAREEHLNRFQKGVCLVLKEHGGQCQRKMEERKFAETQTKKQMIPAKL